MKGVVLDYLEELYKLLTIFGVISYHFDEVAEELPDLVYLSQDDGHEFIDVQDYLVQEVDEEFFVYVWH